MPEIVADPLSLSCSHLFSETRFEESQRLDPDPFLPPARDARGLFANGISGNPASLYFPVKAGPEALRFGRGRADGPSPTPPTPVRHFGAPPRIRASRGPRTGSALRAAPE